MKNTMKKLLALLLALVLTLALAACGQKEENKTDDQTNDPAITDQDNAADEKVTLPVADGAVIGQGAVAFTVEVQGADGKTVTFTGYSLSGADAGNYNLKAQPASVTANITAKVVKLTGGINATDRGYVKDNKTVDLTKGTLTFDGLVSGETLDVNIPTTGTISKQYTSRSVFPVDDF